MKQSFQVIGSLAIVIAVSAFYSLCFGFVASHLWSWFVVRQFHVAEIDIPTAIGIALIPSMMAQIPDGRERPEYSDVAEIFGKVTTPVWRMGWVLLLGWVLHTFWVH